MTEGREEQWLRASGRSASDEAVGRGRAASAELRAVRHEVESRRRARAGGGRRRGGRIERAGGRAGRKAARGGWWGEGWSDDGGQVVSWQSARDVALAEAGSWLTASEPGSVDPAPDAVARVTQPVAASTVPAVHRVMTDFLTRGQNCPRQGQPRRGRGFIPTVGELTPQRPHPPWDRKIFLSSEHRTARSIDTT